MPCCCPGQGGQKVLSAARAEAMLRSLLPDLAPARFQHVMRIMHNEFFVTLDPTGAGGCADPLPPVPPASCARGSLFSCRSCRHLDRLAGQGVRLPANEAMPFCSQAW